MHTFARDHVFSGLRKFSQNARRNCEGGRAKNKALRAHIYEEPVDRPLLLLFLPVFLSSPPFDTILLNRHVPFDEF